MRKPTHIQALGLALCLGAGILQGSANLALGQEARLRLHQVDNQPRGEADTVAEIRFGETVAARILGRESLSKDRELNRYVSLIGTALALHATRPDLQFHFAVMESPEVNAYSAPGGFVFITRGAIEASTSESELAAILAHEIAHISERHIVKALHIRGEEKGDLSAISRLIGASSDTARAAFSQTVDKALELILDTGYEMEQELDCDRIATLLLVQTGYDPQALQRFLQRNQGTASDGAHKMKTHPASQRRNDALRQLLEAEGLTTPVAETATMQTRFRHHVKANHG